MQRTARARTAEKKKKEASTYALRFSLNSLQRIFLAVFEGAGANFETRRCRDGERRFGNKNNRPLAADRSPLARPPPSLGRQVPWIMLSKSGLRSALPRRDEKAPYCSWRGCWAGGKSFSGAPAKLINEPPDRARAPLGITRAAGGGA